MKYYIKSAKGYWLAQGNGYTQNQSEAYAFTLDQMLQFAFNLTAARSSDNPKHSQGVLHYTLLCKVARSYKTITPNTSKTPKAVWGFFVPL